MKLYDALKKLPSLPTYAAGTSVEPGLRASTMSRPGKIEQIGLYNNCTIVEKSTTHVLIKATRFVVEGIARAVCLNVYKIPGDYDTYVVDIRRPAGVDYHPTLSPYLTEVLS